MKRAGRHGAKVLSAVFIMAVMAGLLVLPLASSLVIVVPWQLELREHVAEGNPFAITISGPDNASFVLEFHSILNNSSAMSGAPPDSLPVFKSPFVLPANATSPQSFLTLTIPQQNFSIGYYRADVYVNLQDVVNATFQVVSPYNLTSVAQNVSVLQGQIRGLEITNGNLGTALAQSQLDYITLAVAFVFLVLIVAIIESLRIFGPTLKRQAVLWIDRNLSTRPYRSFNIMKTGPEERYIPDTKKLYHGRCCPLARTTFYTLPVLQYHYRKVHNLEHPEVGPDIYIDQKTLTELREAGRTPEGVVGSKQKVGDFFVSTDGLEGL